MDKDLIQLLISVGGVIAMLGMHYQTVRDHQRRLQIVETDKVDKDVHEKDLELVAERHHNTHTSVLEAHSRIGKMDHRVRNIEQAVATKGGGPQG
jgi:hypothetical protein